MTTLIGCPEPVLLSQLLDRELAQEEENGLRRHVETCIEGNARLDQLAKAKNMAQSGLRHALQSPFVTPSLECFSPERVSAYVQRQLSAGEHEAAERHLRTCQKCLGEVMEAFRITKNLTRKRHVPVPAALKARVASQWKQTPAPAAKEATVLSRFVLQIAQKGLELVDQYVVAPLRDVQTTLAPLPAYRLEDALAPLQLTLHAEQATIAITAVPGGTGLSLSMTIMGPGETQFSAQRVFLRQGGKSIFSARTDREGVVRIPHIEPGAYEFSCAGIQTTFQLELRAPV